jgi:hypothetical protein
MRRFRSSIAGLLGVILFISVALAALRASTDLWDSGILGLTSLCLLTAVLLAVHRTNPKRAYWLGFALFGWTYLIASMIPPIGSRLPTTKALFYLESKLPSQEAVSTFLYRMLVSGDPGGSGSPQPVVPDLTNAGAADWAYTWRLAGAALPGSASTHENFVRIGHSLLALVMAFIGGSLSRTLYVKDHARMAGDVGHPPDNGRQP